MERLTADITVMDVLKDSPPDTPYVQYVRDAYGALTVGQLLAFIDEAKPVDCHNAHELTGQSYVDCPLRPLNSRCSHQCETADILFYGTSHVAVPQRVQQHVNGLLRAGLLVIAAAGGSADTDHEELSRSANGMMDVDNPSFLEYERFRKQSMLAAGSPGIDERLPDRLPSLMATDTLPQLQAAVDKEKMVWDKPVAASQAAVSHSLHSLLGL